MVFESLIADLLNRFLGSYVENLDRSQLKIGIWGGDVVLKDLILKQSALAELDLPVKTVYGHLGKLILKIPWKNLYGAPVECQIEQLLLLVVPNQEVAYDAIKDEKWIQEFKQTKLQQFELAKKKEREKDLPKPDDTFVEKLTTQIIKNVQINIKDIHIRYEDKITLPSNPFSAGITLHSLTIYTTNASKEKHIANDEDARIFKNCILEGLAFYWNCQSKSYSQYTDVNELIQVFLGDIWTKDHHPENFKFILGPINANLFLKMNPKPEKDNYQDTKTEIDFHLEKLDIGISKFQYRDIIALVDSMDRMTKATPYKKYRPNLNVYRGHYKEWWKFAFKCVLEEEIRRKHNNWNWNHMHSHLELCREYSIAFKAKMLNRKMTSELKRTIEECEKNLDVFNLIMIRQRIHLEVIRVLKQESSQENKGWFSGWWTPRPKSEGTEKVDLVQQFEAAMTPEEKDKLYMAIDYDTSADVIEYPPEYVAQKFEFKLSFLNLEIRDDSYSIPRVLYMVTENVMVSANQRPGSKAMRVDIMIDDFKVEGIQQGLFVPCMVSTQLMKFETKKRPHLLSITFEQNPLDNLCDKRLLVQAYPLYLVYDGMTFNKILEVFTPPTDTTSALKELQAAAQSKLQDFRETSASGMEYAISKHEIFDVQFNVLGCKLIIPLNGIYKKTEDIIVINLGNFTINSRAVPRSEIPNVRELYQQGLDSDAILKAMMEKCYDCFDIQIQDTKILLAYAGENWEELDIDKAKLEEMHLLEPMSLTIVLKKCLVLDDPRLPKLKINTQLPAISLDINEQRLLHALSLLGSLREEPVVESEENDDNISIMSHLTNVTTFVDVFSKTVNPKLKIEEKKKDIIQSLEMEIIFTLTDLRCKLYKRDEQLKICSILIDFHLWAFGVEVTKHTFNTQVLTKLGGISLTTEDALLPVRLIDSVTNPEINYLFTINFINVDKASPVLASKYENILNKIEANFTSLNILLHQQALRMLIEWWNSFSENLGQRLDRVNSLIATAQVNKTNIKTPLDDVNLKSLNVHTGTTQSFVRRRKSYAYIDLKVTVCLRRISILLQTRTSQLSIIKFYGVETDVIKTKYNNTINSRLKDITILDLNEKNYHKKIISILGEEALSIKIVQFNEPKFDPNGIDLSISSKMAALQFVYLNMWTSKILNFLNTFHEAQQIVVDKASEAAEVAKEKIENIYEKAIKVQLNINLCAPVIIIPINSRSINALVIDFGELAIQNTFQTLKVLNELGHPAVIEDSKITLTNMKISTVQIGDNCTFKEHSLILKPISFICNIQRNLSASWYKHIANVDMTAKLECINLNLIKADYLMIMAISSENFSEGAQKAKSGFSQMETKEPKVTLMVNSQILLDKTKSKSQTVLVKYATTKSTSDINVKFNFTLERLIINLFTHVSDSQEDLTKEQGLACVILEVLSMKGRMLSDGSLWTSILLVDLLLDDTRPNETKKIRRFMGRKSPATDSQEVKNDLEISPLRSMVDVTFQQKEQDIFLDLRVSSFDLILSTDIIMEITSFFQVPNANIENLPTKQELKRSLSISSTASAEAPGQTNTMMTINLRLEKPEVIIVENMNNIDSNAIIWNGELQFKIRTSKDHQVINGSISEIELYSCCFNPLKRQESKAQILAPTSLSIAGSTPPNKGLHIDVTVSPIILRVSPATIELLSQVNAALKPTANIKDISTFFEKNFSDIWQPHSLDQSSFWYLGTVAEDALVVQNTMNEEIKEELCLIECPTIVLTLEAGVGNQTLPMILLSLSFHAQANNWSSQLSIDSSLQLQMSYYNSSLALWEPLIETVETILDNRTVHVPWELKATVTMNNNHDQGHLTLQSPTNSESDLEEINFPPPAMSIDITSKLNLEVTVTKTCLDTVANLGKAFRQAASLGSSKSKNMAPIVVKNETGYSLTIYLIGTRYKLNQVDPANSDTSVNQIVLEPNAQVGLSESEFTQDRVVEAVSRANKLSPINPPSNEDNLSIKIDGHDCLLDLPVSRADKRYFSLKHRGEGNDVWGIVSQIDVIDGCKILTLRSIIQIWNHFEEPINVYYMTRRGNEVALVGSVQPGKALTLPLNAVYTPTSEIFFSVNDFTVSVVPFVWKDLKNMLTTSKLLQCNPKRRDSKEPFFMRVVGEIEQVYYERTARHTMDSTCYNIHVRPALVLKNHLPMNLICQIQGLADVKIIKSGGRTELPTVEPGASTVVLRMDNYLGQKWFCKHQVEHMAAELTIWTFETQDSSDKHYLDFGMHTVEKNNSLLMSIYCPFWMINKSGVTLYYKQSFSDDLSNVICHPENLADPVLFSFRGKAFCGKKKALVKIDEGDWSEKFSLDVAGSSGVIDCRNKGFIQKLGVHIKLGSNSLTKVITFTPYIVLINNSAQTIEIQENDRPADPWIKIESKKCTPYWPKSTICQARLRITDTQELSSAFAYDQVHTTLLKLDNMYGGICVDIQMMEGATYIKLSDYEDGLAPALIINNTSVALSFFEKDADNTFVIEPNKKQLFTWQKPIGSRVLGWHTSKKDILEKLRQDSIGDFPCDSVSEGKLYWVSFLDGLQRTLLFTSDIGQARCAQAAAELEPIDQEITISVHGLGLSLINNINHVEIMYIAIASSGVIWEIRKNSGKRWKPISPKDSLLIENAYSTYLDQISIDRTVAETHVILESGKIEVNFETLEMLRPNKRNLRRSFQTGLWLQRKTSAHQCQIHLKLNRLQVDNQLDDCVFPVVLAPVPPPKSVSEKAVKPFAELSIVQRTSDFSPVQQFKYFKLLIQEFHIKVDLGFINELMNFYFEEETENEEAERFNEELANIVQPLLSYVSLQSTQEQKNFYDLLHFSPLKIHLSFSMAGSNNKGPSEAPAFLGVLMQSFGVTLTDINDVVFRLAYFEREFLFLTQGQLRSEATMHYVGQCIKQLYVLVLGLDVIGNPFGLVVGVAQGVEDLFYEPFAGAIQGPGEFAEGLVLGMRSLFGHTVGGAAGAVSRITGAMGKGLAALTFDDDYQRKRREALAQKPANVQTGLARSGKGLVMGVVDGVSGVFTKPISGAKEEGVEGFFKGVGKGMVGLVTRPTGGVIDFASGSLNAVKRATEMGDETTRLRPPRFLQQDGLVRAYIKEQAIGNRILRTLEKGKYSATDYYVYHTLLGHADKDMLILTDKRALYIIRNDIFGAWQVDWDLPWNTLVDAPKILENGVLLSTNESRKKVLGLFGSSSSGKLILLKENAKKKVLLDKITEILKKI